MNRIVQERINVADVIASVADPEAGAIDLFIGTTRNHSGSRTVVSLDYEAYEPMALKMMEQIEQETRERYDVHRISIVHRVGTVDVGEASVVIAVSSSHRNEAFLSCRHIIDRLKQMAPIWKREVFADGTVEWSGQSRTNMPNVSDVNP